MRGKCLFILSLVFLIGLAVEAKAQESAKLLDEFSELCSDDIRSRIDGFFYSISEHPNSTGYVVGYPEQSLPGRYEKFVRLISSHIALRNFYPERVRFLRGLNREEMRIQFWLAPPGAPPPGPTPAYSRSAIVIPTLFDSSGIDAIENGNVIFGESNDSAEPCDFGLDLGEFAKEIARDRDLVAVLRATSDSRRSSRFIRRALSLTQQELTRAHGIQRHRIQIIYVGRAKKGEMQLWLVPRDTKPPKRFTSRLPN